MSYAYVNKIAHTKMLNKRSIQLKTRGAGLFQDGSLRAEKMEYDDTREALEQFCIRDLKISLG